MSTMHTVSVLAGDGVGPEIMAVVKRVIEAAKVPIQWEDCLAGAAAFKKGIKTGVPNDTIESIARNKVALKGPLETPVGFGGRSANVTLRKIFETFGNIRPTKITPGLNTPFSGRNINMIVVRENIEDLYAGMEYYQTGSSAESLKLITEHGTEKICRLAFELAEANGFKKVHCATKANIMKFSEGLFKRVFEEVARDYPAITPGHVIIDNCAHQMVVRPEQFEVIVTSNLNGDILSDLASGLVGGLGVAPSANIGDRVSIFESVHGSAPDIAGKGVVNPTALLLSSCMMLRALEEFEAAKAIENALVFTLCEGSHLTADLAHGRPAASTNAFADRVIENFGKAPEGYVYGRHKKLALPIHNKLDPNRFSMATIGADVFVKNSQSLEALASKLGACHPAFHLEKISCRGVQVWPEIPHACTEIVDLLCCRFMANNTKDEATIHAQIPTLLEALTRASIHWMHVEKLQLRDNEPAYS